MENLLVDVNGGLLRRAVYCVSCIASDAHSTGVDINHLYTGIICKQNAGALGTQISCQESAYVSSVDGFCFERR